MADLATFLFRVAFWGIVAFIGYHVLLLAAGLALIASGPG